MGVGIGHAPANPNLNSCHGGLMSSLVLNFLSETSKRIFV